MSKNNDQNTRFVLFLKLNLIISNKLHPVSNDFNSNIKKYNFNSFEGNNADPQEKSNLFYGKTFSQSIIRKCLQFFKMSCYKIF